MVSWEISKMGGVIPRMDDSLIEDNMAVEAVNCDLTGGALIGLPQAEFLIDLSGRLPVVERAYRFPPDDIGDIVWLALPSRYSSVVRSPLANDDTNRVYWTNPGDKAPWFNTQAGIKAGSPPYNLGTVQPTTAPHIDSVTGGTPPPDALAIDRVYLYTYVNSFGEESSPSPASNLMSGPPDATWTVSGFPTAAPANPAGMSYAPIVKYYVYRTVTGATTGAQFFFVNEVALPHGTGTYVDSVPDSIVSGNEVLQSVGWQNPPDYLDGLVSMPGGFLAGFTDNTVHFTEPNRPHTWPFVYDQSAHYPIITLAVWQQYLMVITQGYPSAGSGNMPSNLVLVQSQVPEPCISRGSVVVNLTGVFYASQNGLINFTGYGFTSMTTGLVEKNEWLNYYRAEELMAARHRGQYMAVNNTDAGFIISYEEPRMGIEDLSTMLDVVCIWNDEYFGDTLMCANGKIYEWDCPDTPPQIFRWKSKHFFTPMPLSLGAAQVSLDEEVLDPVLADPIPLDNGDPTMVLPPGVPAQFRYYAGPKLTLIMTRNLTKMQEVFRLPKGFKAFDHQAEILSRVGVSSIQLSTTLEELKKT